VTVLSTTGGQEVRHALQGLAHRQTIHGSDLHPGSQPHLFQKRVHYPSYDGFALNFSYLEKGRHGVTLGGSGCPGQAGVSVLEDSHKIAHHSLKSFGAGVGKFSPQLIPASLDVNVFIAQAGVGIVL
jgi:hypothetical protein